MTSHDLYRSHYQLYCFLALFNQQGWGGPMDDRKTVYGHYWDTTYKPAEFAVVKAQAEEILALPEFPAEAVAGAAGRVFDDAAQCRRWFEKVLRLAEQRVREENP